MTSLNAVVISIRLVISFFIQRLYAELVGEAGISKIGQLRNITELLGSITSIGIFSGVVKYVAEHKEDKGKLQQLFSTTFVFIVFGTLLTSTALFIFAEAISLKLFASSEFSYLIKIMAVVVPFIAVQKVFNGVVNALSEYKKLAKIDLISYVLSAILTIVFLFQYNIDGALVAIAITPAIQLIVLLFIFFKVLKEYIHFKNIKFKIPMAKGLLAFSLMSFFSTVLVNYVEIDVRTMLVNRITEADAGIWTAMTFLSKNYMVFAGSIFTLYVVPKFAGIYTKTDFKAEIVTIYKTLLPIFGLGMLLIFFFKDFIISLIYPGFEEMAPLFKWQLMGDFIRLGSLVLAHQFIAKKMVRNFIFSEVLSLALFYGLAYYLATDFGVEGVVMAHFIRYVVYFIVVFFLVFRYFRKEGKKVGNKEN